MLNVKSFLAVDFGAGTLKLAEFEISEAGGLRLIQYGIRPLGAAGAQEAMREQVILKAIQELLSTGGFRSKNINICAPGYHVFSKFVKLPPVDTSKVQQIIQYEAQQNVPFPLEEVVWDYQILGSATGGELEVLLVAIKTDVVGGLFRVAEKGGLRVQLVDVSPAALCNAFRYNYGDLDGCTMLLDIGAKTSNLLFFEGGKVYSRSINIGANSITQDFATESKLKFDDAEAAKIEKGFVSLGGAYEEPEDPQAAAISKIARQVMTRLHIQVNQTMQFYRGQQGGSAPQRLFLSGGASVMAYTSQFFAEKINVPVDYFNPFRNVELGPSVNVEELSKVAHSFGEVVGLGLRNLAHCPVELNLMPKNFIQRQALQQKKPYFVAAMFSLVAVLYAVSFFYHRVVSNKQVALEELKTKIHPLQQKEQAMKRAQGEMDKLKQETEKIVELVNGRFYWPDLMAELRRVMLTTETKTRQKLNNAEVGLWIESFLPQAPAVGASSGGQAFAPQMGAPDGGKFVAEMPPEFSDRYGIDPLMGMQAAPDQPVAAPASENEMTLISVICRGVDLERFSPSGNSDLAYALRAELANSPWFDGEGTTLEPIKKEENALTFSFGMTIKLKRPFKFKYGMD